jgi:hypothetical protein
LELRTIACAVNHAVIFNSARQAKFRPRPDLFHPHRLGGASQVNDITRILQAMGGHDNVASEALAGPYRLIQQAVEAIPADVPGFGAQRMPRILTP